MGVIIYRATTRPGQTQPWWLMGLYVFAANAPDLDVLPGLVVGNLSRFHHGPSHSIGLALAFGALASLFFARKIYAFAVAFSLYFSHVLLDYLVWDPPPSRGVPLFWPFSTEYYMTPFAFFPSFHYMAKPTEFILSSLFTLHNFFTVTTEILLLSPLLIVVWIWTRRRHELKNFAHGKRSPRAETDSKIVCGDSSS
jgi:inner membrane protein